MKKEKKNKQPYEAMTKVECYRLWLKLKTKQNFGSCMNNTYDR